MRAPDEALLREWFDRIDDDLKIIQNTISGEYVASGIAFHAHQASEKMLKVVLLSQGVKPPYIHSLNKLMDLVQNFPLRDQMLILLNFEDMHLNSRDPSEGLRWKPPTKPEAIEWIGQL